jgi:hypothetical protein
MIKSFWNGNTLVTEAYDSIRTSAETVVRSHTSRSYGKLLGVNYTWFQTQGNHVACSFPQKIGPLQFSLTFEKVVERLPEKTLVHFRTVDSKADITGMWLISPTPMGTFLSLKQETTVPALLKWLPVKMVVESKIKNVYEKLRVLP